MLEKRARKVILQQMKDLPEINTDTVVELIEPHFIPDYEKLLNQAKRRTANNLIKRLRDEKGDRTFFAVKDDSGRSKYVNVDITRDISSLNKIQTELEKKLTGITVSVTKVKKKRQELLGQIEMAI